MIKIVMVLALMMGISACRCAGATEDGMSTKPSDTVGCQQFRDEQLGCKLVYPDT